MEVVIRDNFGAILISVFDKKVSVDSPLQAKMMTIKLGPSEAAKRILIS